MFRPEFLSPPRFARPRSSLWLALIAVPVVTFLVAASETSPRAPTPLDLPSGGEAQSDEEEDAAEAIRFFGEVYEGDGFFFLLDRSGSMSGMKLDILKGEMNSALSELSESSEFGIVAFSGDISVFSPMPLEANSSNITAAREWVNALQAYGSTMMLGAAIELLTITQAATNDEREVIVVGDGNPNSPGPTETLEGILAANTEGLPFHTILIGSNESAIDFMTALATATGGTYRHQTF